MNSILNKNLELFQKRFPALSQNFSYSPNPDFTVEESKQGTLTAKYKNLLLHSKYNPTAEASNLLSTFNEEKQEYLVFISFGLGYAPLEACKKFKDKTIILIEQDDSLFFQALNYVDFTPLFQHEKLVLLLGATTQEINSLLSKFNYDELAVFTNQNQISHCKEYAQEIIENLKKNKQTEKINSATLEKFSKLWMRNSLKNAKYIYELDGVNKYQNLGTNIPFVVVAAGPSLKQILPQLKEIQKRAFIVCVDTAVHSLLKEGIQSDFIILVDPQFYCASHLHFLKSENSILILESAVYPSVFDFNCKEKVLCSSMYPVGKYFETIFGNKGTLAAGGSVTTTAWDFANFCGSKEIYIAGMDLGFPKNQTHIKGSQFENKALFTSNKTNNFENDNVSSLLTASPIFKTDYNDEKILTDKKFELFSWWFKENVEKANKQGISTYSLTSESLKIPGIEYFSVEDFLSKPEISQLKKEFFNNAEKQQQQISQNQNKNLTFVQVFDSFKKDLQQLELLSKKGIDLCNKAIQNRTKIPQITPELNKIDTEILTSKTKNVASLVFPTREKLNEKTSSIQADKDIFPFYYSKIVYTELLSAVKQYSSLI